MKRMIRRGAAVLMLLCALSFAGVGYGRFAIPDTVPVLNTNESVLPKLFAFSGAENQKDVRFLHTIPVKKSRVRQVERDFVVPLGSAFGIKLYTDGVMVVRTDVVDAEQGAVSPAKKADIRDGDMILAIGGEPVRTNSQAAKLFSESDGSPLTLRVRRQDVVFETTLEPLRSLRDGRFHAGIWVRDSSAGIGTMSFYSPALGVFGGLGHAVCDVDTGQLLPIAGGEAVDATIKGSYKGRSGDPGELCGVFGNRRIGELIANTDCGVYGVSDAPEGNTDAVPVAMYYEVQTGGAVMLAEVDEEGVRAYHVEITKLFQNPDAKQKNLVVKVTDTELIRRTGGIVQGMSGSPILQNGMLVGAVTHVFVGDPLQGFGVYAQTMVNEAKELSKKQDAA